MKCKYCHKEVELVNGVCPNCHAFVGDEKCEAKKDEPKKETKKETKREFKTLADE